MAAVFALFATGAEASAICDDLWFARNAVFDAAGYCFRSPLGRAVFDNGDCTGATAVVGRDIAARVTRIRAREQRLGCRVNTDRTELDLPDLGERRALDVQPLRRTAESQCIGYIGPAILLRRAPEPEAEVIGAIRPGDSVLAQHEPEEGWAFASQVSRPESLETALGWHRSELTICEARAG
ncbi:MAG: DUF4453 domain-containing protein [Pseudomonadota bacterium]